jgi:protease-4
MRNSVIAAAIVCLMALINSVYSASAGDTSKANLESRAVALLSAETAAEDGQTEASSPVEGEEKTAESQQKKISIAQIPLKGSLPESAPEPGLFGDMQQNLTDTLRRLRRAADDDDVQGVILRIRSPSIGRAKLAELRASIDRLQASGKKVYADIESAKAVDYLIACACDEIVMPEPGMLLLPGVRAEVTYYKGLLDKLGIKADMMQVGDYKGAAEPFTRDRMSPEVRKQFETVIDDFYEQMAETIAADRGLPKDKVKQLIDRGLFPAEQARQAGLVDTIAYSADFQRRLKTEHQADQLTLLKNYGREDVDTDFSGMMGFFKLFDLMSGASSKRRSSDAKKIAIIYGVGAIMDGQSGSSLLGGQVLGGDTIVRALQKAGDDETVVAVVFRVDSPGGSALASDLIWRQVQLVRKKKPVIASMGDVAASGGYYIAVGCDKIYAGAGTLTGSIGVVGGKLAMGGLFDKVGFSTEVISRGQNSGMFSMETPFSDSEREVWKEYMNDVYGRFTDRVATGRKLDRKQLDALAGGRVWSGRQAKANGLVDEVGTFYDAIEAAKKMAGIQPKEKIEYLELPRPRNFLEQLLDAPEDEARLQLRTAAQELAPGAAKHLGELRTLQRLFEEPALLMMPYRVEIK